MKKIIIIACFFVVNMSLAFAQNKGVTGNPQVEKVLTAYKSEVKPYLEAMAEREYPNYNNDVTLFSLREAKLAVLKVYHRVIKDDVYKALEITKNMESVPKSRLDSIPYIDVLVKRAYSMHYTGLPYEFYKKASDKAKENE